MLIQNIEQGDDIMQSSINVGRLLLKLSKITTGGTEVAEEWAY